MKAEQFRVNIECPVLHEKLEYGMSLVFHISVFHISHISLSYTMIHELV